MSIGRVDPSTYNPIRLQTQPDGETCTSACIAMLLGVDVAEVVADYHDEWRGQGAHMNPGTYMQKRGAWIILGSDPYSGSLWHGRVYLLTVPSLNMEAKNHHVVWDGRDGTGQVFDPNDERDGMRFYVDKDQDMRDGSVRLGGYAIDFEMVGMGA